MEPARTALRARYVDDLLDGLLTLAIEERRLREEGYHRDAGCVAAWRGRATSHALNKCPDGLTSDPDAGREPAGCATAS